MFIFYWFCLVFGHVFLTATYIFLSDEDMEIKALVAAWLAKQTDDVRAKLTPWMDNFFYK